MLNSKQKKRLKFLVLLKNKQVSQISSTKINYQDTGLIDLKIQVEKSQTTVQERYTEEAQGRNEKGEAGGEARMAVRDSGRL